MRRFGGALFQESRHHIAGFLEKGREAQVKRAQPAGLSLEEHA